MTCKKLFSKLTSLILIAIICLNAAACSSGSTTKSDLSATKALIPTDIPVITQPSEPLPTLASPVQPTITPAISSPDTSSQDAELFDELTTNFYFNYIVSDTLNLHYSVANPENFGVVQDKVTFGNYDIEESTRQLAEIKDIIAELEKLNYDNLDSDRQLAYDCFINFASVLVRKADYIYYEDMLGPSAGIQAQLPILLAEYTFYDIDDIETYIELLGCTTEYFNSICEFQQAKSDKGFFMADASAESVIAQCRSFIEKPEKNILIDTFNDRIDAFEGLTSDQKGDYKARNKEAVLNSVIPAYQLLIDTLTQLLGTATNQNGLCHFEEGKEYYEVLCQYNTGSDKSIEEMKSMLTSELLSCMTKLTSMQLQNPDIINKFSKISYPETEPERILEHLKDAITNDFPILYDVNYTVNYVPESLKDYLSPAMYLLPPIDDMNNNRIYINSGKNTDMSMIYPTLAHEGYPGHLYQTQYFANTAPSLARYCVQALGYEEGWANYCELYSYKLAGLDEALADYCMANSLALHCIYSLVDIGIHYEGWTVENTVKYWAGFGIDEATAKEIHYDILAEPGIYLPYSIGYLELTALRDKMNEAMGDRFEILDFHTFYLDTGVAGFSVLNDYLDKYLAEN